VPAGTLPPGTPYTPPIPPPPAQSNIPGPLPGFLRLPQAALPGATYTLYKSVSLTEEYTDNFNLFEVQEGPVSPGTQVQTQQKQSNFRTSLSGGLTLAINGARTRGFVSAGLSVAYDTADDGLKGGLFPSLTAGIIHDINPRLRLTVTDTLSRNDNTFQGDPFGIRRERAIYFANFFSAGVDWLLDRIATKFYYNNSIFSSQSTFDEGEGGTTVSHVFGANATVPIELRTAAQVGYELSFSDTNDEGVNVGNLFYGQITRQVGRWASVGLSGSYQVFTQDLRGIANVSLITSYGLPNGLSISASLGYSYLMGEDDNEGTISSSTQISYAFPTGASVSVGVFSGFRSTFITGEDFGVVQTRTYFGSFFYPITPFIGGSLNVSYSQNDLTGAGNTPSPDQLDSLSVNVNFTWPIRPWLSANAGYSYYRYTGGRVAQFQGLGIVNVPGGPITENRAYVTLAASF
jgi:hypothetical protein